MCRIDGCERHEFNDGVCLYHLKVRFGLIEEPKRKRRTKKVDAVEVMTTDATEPVEEREENE